MTATFADDTAILSKSSSQNDATKNLQRHLDKVISWAKRWKIKFNKTKSQYIVFTLRHDNASHRAYIADQPITQTNVVKYLGIHLDSRLTWKPHVKMKCRQIKKTVSSLYWLIGRRSTLSVYCKRLIYLQIIKSIWTYGIALWGCSKKSNQQLIQTRQNVILRIIVDAYRYSRNDGIHRDLAIKSVSEVIRDIAKTHERRLHRHPNSEAKELLDVELDTRRLKRTKPHHDLI